MGYLLGDDEATQKERWLLDNLRARVSYLLFERCATLLHIEYACWYEPFGGDEKTKYTLTFFQVNSGTNLLLFIIALTVGSGAISADNKANALLVYLSKPLTKADYLLGKWMGIFFTLFLETFVPSLVLYLYCLTSYLDKGFLKNDPMLFFKMIAAACVPAAMHASLLVGASAWSKAPRIASVFYASLYFGSLVVTGMVFGIVYRGDFERGQEVLKLSLSGMMDGIQQIIYHITIKILWRR